MSSPSLPFPYAVELVKPKKDSETGAGEQLGVVDGTTAVPAAIDLDETWR
jgi:hypothetical protein